MASIMWDYIREEQSVLKRVVASDQTVLLAEKIARKVKAVYFVSHGSSYNAAVSILPYFNNISGVRAYAYTPENLFSVGSALLLEDRKSTLVVGISQTGTSSGVLSALSKAIKEGFGSLAITATVPSPIEKMSDNVLNLMCGEEDSNAKTKGYSATLTVLLLLSLSIGRKTGILSEKEYGEYISEIKGMVDALPEVTEKGIAFGEKNHFGKDLKNLYVLASGVHLGSAQEGQLKVMETMCIPTMFNDIGEFSHGMHRSINNNSSLLFIRCADGKEAQVALASKFFDKLKASVWVIDCTGNPVDLPGCISIPCFKKTQSLLLVVLIIQILSVMAPEYNGLDPNRDAHNDFTIVDGTRVQ